MTGRKKKSRIPEFKSRHEEAEWFDTHDMGDYQEEFKTVRARFAKNLSSGITARLTPAPSRIARHFGAGHALKRPLTPQQERRAFEEGVAKDAERGKEGDGKD